MFPTRSESKPAVQNNNAMVKLISSLMRMQHSLFRKEMDYFLAARIVALNVVLPNRYTLLQLYRDIELDLFIKGQVGQRINRIKNQKFKIVNKKTGEIDEEKTKLINKKWLKQFMRYAMESKFWGFSLVYFTQDANNKPIVNLTLREHVLPDKNLILISPFDQHGIDYINDTRVNKSVIPIGDPTSLGLYENIAIAYFMRKHSWSNWDEFEELFGIPIRYLTTSSTDKKVLDQLESYMQTMGTANYGIFPQDSKLEVKEGRTQDAHQVFNEKRKAANEEISMLINGHAEGSSDKGSRAKSETMIVNTQAEITADDKSDIADLINEELLPKLALLFGMPFTEEDEFQWDDTRKLEPKVQADIFKIVNDMGYEIEQDSIEEALSIQIVGKKEVKTKGKDKTKPDNSFQSILELHEMINKLHYDV
jgi:hypothetical protein